MRAFDSFKAERARSLHGVLRVFGFPVWRQRKKVPGVGVGHDQVKGLVMLSFKVFKNTKGTLECVVFEGGIYLWIFNLNAVLSTLTSPRKVGGL